MANGFQLAGGPGGAYRTNGAFDPFGVIKRSQSSNSGKGPVSPNSAQWAPLKPSTPTKTVSPGGGGGGGGGGNYYGGGGGGGYAPAPPPPAPAPPSEENYLAGDATYQATISALAKQLQNFTADIDAQRETYGLDYDRSLQNLGYIAPAEEGGDASWNWNDTLTASGRAYQNQVNDFAARNMLQSQGYADAVANLQRSLMDQFTGMQTARDTFMGDLDRQVASTTDENTAASQAARAEAIMRRAMQYGLTT